jgi:exodeoxyribonuclease V alpha subunit
MTDLQEGVEATVDVRRRRFHNAETGFAVLECELDGEPVVLVGLLGHLEERERAQIRGTWVDDRRYGPQVKVAEALPLAPTDPAALEEYLRRVRYIGARRAQALIERYGDQVLTTIDRDPEQAFASIGLSGRRAAAAAQSWDGLRALRELHLLLAPHGLAYLAARIHREHGDQAHRVIRERPYDLTGVFGVGFELADRIARGVGVPAESPERAAAAVLHALAEAERFGSTCLPAAALGRRAGELLGSEPGWETVERLVEAGEVVVADDDGIWVYRTATEELEAELAERVLELTAAGPVEGLRAPDDAEPGSERSGAAEARAWPAPVGAEALLPDGGELAAEQWAGIRTAFSERLSVITGGPGTGKTASIRAIGAIAAGQGAEVLLVAPTGRAAKRMTEATALPATTIHSALGWIPGKGSQRDEDDPLGCDLLIVDETSMASLEVLVTLLRAVGPDTHVVLVGDADQLAPVGAGKPFAELVESELVPTARLQHIFRQAAGSMIVQAAHAIRTGALPSFEHAPEMRRDLFLVERPDPVRAREEIVQLVTERLPAHYGVDPIADIQVLAPVYRGEVGIDALNRELREVLNPGGTPVGGGRLRIGDKLMLTGRNLHELGLMNGTLLRLEGVREGSDEDEDDGALVVAADDQLFELDQRDADRLQPAYACSVHKGQGIELPIAVVVAHPAGGDFFLRREMLYTAITRATLATVIVGTRNSLARAVRSTDAGRRHSRLVPRLRCAHTR